MRVVSVWSEKPDIAGLFFRVLLYEWGFIGGIVQRQNAATPVIVRQRSQ